MRLHDMRPTRAVSNPSDIPALDAKGVRNALVRVSACNHCSDGSHNGVIQLCLVMALALFTAMPGHVSHVLRVRSPLEIHRPIISSIPIQVARLHSDRATTNERFENQMMNVARSDYSIGTLEADDHSMVSTDTGAELAHVSSDAPFIVVRAPNDSIRVREVAGIVGDGTNVCHTDQDAIRQRKGQS